MLKIKVRISETKYLSFYKSLKQSLIATYVVSFEGFFSFKSCPSYFSMAILFFYGLILYIHHILPDFLKIG